MHAAVAVTASGVSLKKTSLFSTRSKHCIDDFVPTSKTSRDDKLEVDEEFEIMPSDIEGSCRRATEREVTCRLTFKNRIPPLLLS